MKIKEMDSGKWSLRVKVLLSSAGQKKVGFEGGNRNVEVRNMKYKADVFYVET